MDTAQTAFQTALLGVAATIVAALIGAGATLLAVRLQRSTRKLRIVEGEPIEELNVRDAIGGLLEIAYDGKPVKRVVSIAIELKNVGREVLTDLTVVWRIESAGRLLLMERMGQGDRDMVPDDLPAPISFEIDFLNPGEFFRLRAVIAGDVQSHAAVVRAPGLRVERLSAAEVTERQERKAGLFGSVASILGVAVALLAASLSSKVLADLAARLIR